MTIQQQAHTSAVKDLLELMNIAAILALFSDCIWVFRDMRVGGITFGLIVVASGLVVGFSIAVYGGYKYHMVQVKTYTKTAMKAKMKICRAKHKRTAR